MKAWILTEGKAGMEAQAKALAAALGVEAQLKHVQVSKLFAWLPNSVFACCLSRFVVPAMLTKKSEPLSQPWPELIISCGRRGAIASMGMRARNSASKFIHIQDPHVSPNHFDVVIAMAHDAITGDNVIKTPFALHAITPEKLAEAAAHFAPHFAAYARPLISVLIGGSTNKYTLTQPAMQAVIAQLRLVLTQTEGSLLITTSRRTGEKNTALVHEAFHANPRVYIYNGEGENPFMGMLALADHLLVTNDSVNMMSEARATGKPLSLLALPGHTNTKPARFAEALLKQGYAHEIGETLSWQLREVADDMPALAKEVWNKLRQ